MTTEEERKAFWTAALLACLSRTHLYNATAEAAEAVRVWENYKTLSRLAKETDNGDE